ncbi:serine/threonine protein kinase [bacterium]|nr:serine/threonine protein kinase [bacterium]
MEFRVPAPDGRMEEGQPILVLPDNTVLRGYRISYMTCGGMSVVYKGFKEGKKYVIKEVSSTDSRNVMSLIQEKAVLERLDHPGIVQVIELFDEDGYYYMVTEFIDGVTVDRRLPPGENNFLSETVVRDWAYQLFDIFEYLHNQTPPVIYRDLKPKNIMIDKEGHLKLIDFGIARTYKKGRHQDTEHMGSMVTASPEHYGAQTDARSDIYTIGATLHYILTNGKTMECNAFDIPSVKVFNKNVTDQFAKVIEKALMIQPNDRFQTVAEMRDALKGSNYLASPVTTPTSLKIESARSQVNINTPPTLNLELNRTGLTPNIKRINFEENDSEVKLQNAHEALRGIQEMADTFPAKSSSSKSHKSSKKEEVQKSINTILTILFGIIGGMLLAGAVVHFFLWKPLPSVIPWTEAKKYDGKEIAVEGEVREVYKTSKDNIYLYFNEKRSDSFRIGIFSENFAKFHCTRQPKEYFENEYLNRIVRMKGKIRIEQVANDSIPTMFAEKPEDIIILQAPPGKRR